MACRGFGFKTPLIECVELIAAYPTTSLLLAFSPRYMEPNQDVSNMEIDSGPTLVSQDSVLDLDATRYNAINIYYATAIHNCVEYYSAEIYTCGMLYPVKIL